MGKAVPTLYQNECRRLARLHTPCAIFLPGQSNRVPATGKQPSPLSPCSSGGRRAQSPSILAGELWMFHGPSPCPSLALACVAVPACGCCMSGLGLGCCTAPLPAPSGKIKICYAHALYHVFCEAKDWEARTSQVPQPLTSFNLKNALCLFFPTLATGGISTQALPPSSILGQSCHWPRHGSQT